MKYDMKVEETLDVVSRLLPERMKIELTKEGHE